MATTKTKPTKQHVAEAVDTLAKWFPEEAANLKDKRDDIIRHIFEGTEPAKGSAILLLKSSEGKAQAKALVALPQLTPCEEAVAVVVVDAIFFVIGMVGLRVSNQERMARAIIRELGPETLRGFARTIHNFNSAEGAYNKAKALFALLGEIYNAGGFSAVFKILKDEMTWWEWVKTGLIAVAQIVAWFATDGVAFIAEAALSIMSAEQLIEDAIKAGKACS